MRLHWGSQETLVRMTSDDAASGLRDAPSRFRDVPSEAPPKRNRDEGDAPNSLDARPSGRRRDHTSR